MKGDGTTTKEMKWNYNKGEEMELQQRRGDKMTKDMRQNYNNGEEMELEQRRGKEMMDKER